MQVMLPNFTVSDIENVNGEVLQISFNEQALFIMTKDENAKKLYRIKD